MHNVSIAICSSSRSARFVCGRAELYFFRIEKEIDPARKTGGRASDSDHSTEKPAKETRERHRTRRAAVPEASGTSLVSWPYLVPKDSESAKIEEIEMQEEDSDGRITGLLAALRSGDTEAQNQLAELVYRDLHRIAAARMRSEPAGHLLQTTALVNEAYMKLLGASERNWQNRCHFYAVAAQIMRRILVDHVRASHAAKRGGAEGARPARLDFDAPTDALDLDNLLALDAALCNLEALDARQCKVVELRYFAGLTEDEVAEVLGVNARTVKRDWNMARAFLRQHIGQPS
jgi:RNA polymerase sigma factor (TIGR02999 family)